MVFPLTLDLIHVFHYTITDVNDLFPDSRSKLACVAGGIVGVRNNVLTVKPLKASREENGEDFEIPPARKP